MQPPFESELHVVIAEHLVNRKCKLSGVLALLVIAVRIAADAGIAGGIVGILIDEDGWDADEAVGIQIRRKAELAERIGDSAGAVVGADIAPLRA